ncbi:MAG: ferrichrome ABC transporter permease, partial [Sutterella sp. 54_7]
MKTFSIGALIAAAAALGLSILCTFTLDNALSWTDRVNLIFDPASAESFDAYYFAFGTLPRFAAAAIGGALLGLVGSLLQQLTQNPMTSPLTLGTSSGGWLAVVLISAFFPAAAGAWLSLGAFAGALAAFGLILLIAGPRGMTGVALIIAGMVVNLLFGAIATAVVLLRAQFVENVFLWGAGDLAQNGWGGITALLPQTVPVVILLLIFAPRALALISLGDEGARARGLPIVPVFGVLAALGIWLSSAFIAAAGVINFTGLIAPNIARRVGFVNPRTQLCASMLIGAALLCATVPTGVVSAIIGTPIFIWIARKSLSALARGGAQPGQASGMVRSSLKKLSIPGLIMLAAAMLLLIVLNFTFINREGIWTFALADKFELLLRIPRFITAAAAGAGLAAAGVILQRLIRNPLASPDILGVSSGAAFAMVVSALYFGGAVGSLGSLTAAGGSFVVLLVLLGLSKSSRFSPDVVVLMGIAISAFLDSAVTLALSRGTMENYFILQWLSGSTYRTTPLAAAMLMGAVLVLISIAFAASRSMTLLSISRDFAQSRGLSLTRSALGLLTLCALLCASATAAMGPVAFVGLVAPHMAVMIGARTVKTELCTAALLGAALVSWA